MANGKEMINELDYRQRIKDMKPRELSEFTALQVYETCIIVQKHEKRIITLENRDRKWVGIGGGIGAVVAAIGYAIINFLQGG